MCRIEIIVEQVPEARRSQAVARVRELTGLGVSLISERIRTAKPVVTETLFTNDHDAVATRLRALVRELTAMGASVRAFELSESEVSSPPADHGDELSTEALLNMLDMHDEGQRAQRAMWDEHGHV